MASKPTADVVSGQSGFVDSGAGTWQDRRGNGNGGSRRLLEEYTADHESEGETEGTSLYDSSNDLSQVHLDFPACLSSSTTALPWPDETMPPFSNHDAEVSYLEPSGSKYSWAFLDHRARPIDTQVPTTSLDSNREQPGDVAINAYGMHAQACPTNVQTSGASDEAMGLDLLTTSAHTASFNPINSLDARRGRARDRVRERAWLPDSSGMSSTGNPTLLENSAKTEAGIKLGKKPLSINESQHRRMQELSKFAMDLYGATNDPENHQSTSGGVTTITFQDHLVGSVLKSSNTFLTLLSSFTKAATPSTPFLPSPPTPSMNHNNPTYGFGDSGTSPSALDIDDHAKNEPVQHSHNKLLGSSDDSKPPPPIDMATALQLLTCYIHIIHLHSIMHARILDYMSAFLQHNPEHFDSVPPVFPDMRVGGVSLNRFGTFQLELLLRISVHVLGEIESALGLPQEFRVGKSKEGRTGVLGASVSGDFVKCLMSEGTCRGKVESVREQLEKLRSVLKRAVD